jgi:hypothetical protein
METVFITFRSITAAQRGERILKDANFSPLLQRTPRWMQERGCGYSLRLRFPAAAPAVTLLRQKGAQFVKVYAQNDEGQPREIAL